MKKALTSFSKLIAICLAMLMTPFMLQAQWVFEITSPAEIAGTYPMGIASFGALPSDTTSGNLQLAFDATDNPSLGCESLETDLSGTIGVLDRGDCAFAQKALNAQQAGAIALVICNTADQIINMPGTAPEVTIQTVLLRSGDCEAIKEALTSGDVGVEIYRIPSAIWANGFDDPSDWIIDGPDGFGPQNGFSITNSSGPNITWAFSTRINSETGGNYALFQNGNPNNPASILRAGPHTLTYSNPINVGGISSPVLKFNQAGARFFELQSAQISTDGGNSWITIGTNDDIAPLTAGGGSQYPNPMPRLYNIYPFLEDGVDEILLRFLWDNAPNHPNMDLFYVSYGWFIDDVEIIEIPATNIRLENSYNPIASFATPQNHISQTQFQFGLNIQNLGLTQDQIDVFVDIRNSETNEIVFNLKEEYLNAEQGVDTLYVFDFLGTIDFEPGTYVVTYRVDAPGKIDLDYSDNVESFVFQVTESLFALDDPAIDSFANSVLRQDPTWYWGSAYYIAPQPEDEPGVFFHGSDHAFNVEGGEYTDELALVYLLEFVPDGGPSYNFTNTINPALEITPDLHPAFTQIAVAIIDTELLINAGPGKIFHLPYDSYLDPVNLTPFDLPIELNQDKLYFLVTQIDQSGTTPSLRIAFNPAISYDNRINNAILFTNGRNFTGFSDAQAPIIRMHVGDGIINSTRILTSNGFDIYTFPNPATNDLFIDFDLQQPTDLEIQLFDINGRLLNSKSHTNVTGEIIGTDVTNFQAGNYIIRVITKDGRVQSQQIIIVK